MGYTQGANTALCVVYKTLHGVGGLIWCRFRRLTRASYTDSIGGSGLTRDAESSESLLLTAGSGRGEQ